MKNKSNRNQRIKRQRGLERVKRSGDNAKYVDWMTTYDCGHKVGASGGAT